jgi:cytochrome c556
VLHALALRLIVVTACLGLFALAAGSAPSTPFGGQDNLKDINNWSELMPEPIYNKILEEAVKSLQDKTKSNGEFNQKSKALTNEAYSLIMYAEVARRASNGGMAQKALGIIATAKELAATAKAKDLEASRKHVAELANLVKKGNNNAANPVKEPLQELVPIHNLMEEVQNVNKEMVKYKRMRAEEIKAKAKSDEVQRNAHRLLAFSVAITAHVPDKDIPKGKSKEDWFKACDDLRKATLEISAAAKAKNQSNLRAAINKMDTACTKCHDDFRVEIK